MAGGVDDQVYMCVLTLCVAFVCGLWQAALSLAVTMLHLNLDKMLHLNLDKIQERRGASRGGAFRP